MAVNPHRRRFVDLVRCTLDGDEVKVIAIHGCDDTTYLKGDFTMEQEDFLIALSEFSSKASTISCMPTIEFPCTYGEEDALEMPNIGVKT